MLFEPLMFEGLKKGGLISSACSSCRNIKMFKYNISYRVMLWKVWIIKEEK